MPVYLFACTARVKQCGKAGGAYVTCLSVVMRTNLLTRAEQWPGTDGKTRTEMYVLINNSARGIFFYLLEIKKVF